MFIKKHREFLPTHYYLVGNFLVLCRANFPTFLTLDFPLLLIALGNRFKFHINLVQGFKKLLNGILDLSLKRHRQIHFLVLPIQVYCLGYNYCISNRLKALKTKLSPLEKNGIQIRIQIISFSQWSNIIENGAILDTVKQVQGITLQFHYTRHIIWHVSIAT